MLDDWNGDGKIDFEDQMLQDEFDDWAMEQYRKRNKPTSDDFLDEENDLGWEDTDSTPSAPPVSRPTAQKRTYHRPAPTPKPEPSPRPVEQIPQKALPKESRVSRRRKARIRRAVVALITFVLIVAISSRHVSRTNRVETLYRNAQEYCLAGSYDEAEECLYELWDMEGYSFRDVRKLLCYCDGRSYYEQGDIEGAYRQMKDEDSLQYLPDERSAELEREYRAFQEQVRQKYTVYQAEQEKLKREEYENKIVNGVPFVGMPESRIADTTLGRPEAEVRHNTEMIRGQVYKANLYDWRVNGHRIFSARCLKGKVVKVWDERDKDTSMPFVPYQQKKKTQSRHDDYDVYDYDDPEDFYFDHEDEFEDYEDAEDYYDEAWE